MAPVAPRKPLTPKAVLALEHVDHRLAEVGFALPGINLSKDFAWPFHTKSEPVRRITVPTWDPDEDPRKQAQMLRLATLRSVDSYFHRFHRNARFAQRARRSPSSGGQAWDRYYLYKPDLIIEIADIFRFHHN